MNMLAVPLRLTLSLSKGVFVVNAPDAAFGHRDWHTGFLGELPAGFIKTNQRLIRIARPPVDNQHIFPCRYECAVLFRRDNPLFFKMGLERVFLRTLPTVLWLAASTI